MKNMVRLLHIVRIGIVIVMVVLTSTPSLTCVCRGSQIHVTELLILARGSSGPGNAKASLMLAFLCSFLK